MCNLYLGEEISEKAVESWLRDISFQPDRGKILDIKGRELTTNETAASVIIIPQQIKNKEETAKHLAHILNISEADAMAYVSKQAIECKNSPGRKKNK